MSTNSFRNFSLVFAILVSVTAEASDTFSNLSAGPDVYDGGGRIVDSLWTPGCQFTATMSGSLSGFSLAMNDYLMPGPQAFSVTLYEDDGKDRLGALLGTYSGLSTGVSYFDGPRSVLAQVQATGNTVSLTSGNKYWVVATSTGSIAWHNSHDKSQLWNYGPYGYSISNLPAFAVHLQSIPEPGTLFVVGISSLICGLRSKRPKVNAGTFQLER